MTTIVTFNEKVSAVLCSVSGEPLARAELKLSRVLPGQEETTFIFGVDQLGQGLPTMLTDSDGTFLLKDIDPGQYRLTASRKGYTEQVYRLGIVSIPPC